MMMIIFIVDDVKLIHIIYNGNWNWFIFQATISKYRLLFENNVRLNSLSRSSCLGQPLLLRLYLFYISLCLWFTRSISLRIEVKLIFYIIENQAKCRNHTL
jgi:hypothetical protein